MNWNGNGIGLRIWATLVGLAAIGGCQNNAPNVADHTPRAEQVEADKTVTVGVEDPANEISPAALPPQELAEASTPEEVCQILHHALDAEDRIGWQKCLSKSATRQIHLADLELMLPASSESAVSIGSTQYATSKRKVAFVPCFVHELVDGKTEKSQFSWQLRNDPGGWRVTGMLLGPDSDGSLDLLSFENPQDIAELKSWSSSEPTRVATPPRDSQFK